MQIAIPLTLPLAGVLNEAYPAGRVFAGTVVTWLVVIPLMVAVTAWFRTRSNRAYRRVRERLGLVTATLAEDISGMRVVQTFTREPESQAAFRGVNERYRESNHETVILNGLYFPAVDFLASLATASVDNPKADFSDTPFWLSVVKALFIFVYLLISTLLEGYHWTPLAVAGALLAMAGLLVVLSGRKQAA